MQNKNGKTSDIKLEYFLIINYNDVYKKQHSNKPHNTKLPFAPFDSRNVFCALEIIAADISRIRKVRGGISMANTSYSASN